MFSGSFRCSGSFFLYRPALGVFRRCRLAPRAEWGSCSRHHAGQYSASLVGCPTFRCTLRRLAQSHCPVGKSSSGVCIFPGHPFGNVSSLALAFPSEDGDADEMEWGEREGEIRMVKESKGRGPTVAAVRSPLCSCSFRAWGGVRRQKPPPLRETQPKTTCFPECFRMPFPAFSKFHKHALPLVTHLNCNPALVGLPMDL